MSDDREETAPPEPSLKQGEVPQKKGSFQDRLKAASNHTQKESEAK
jgi:hypothetical protein